MDENHITAEAVKTQGFQEHNPQLYFAFVTVVQRVRLGNSEKHRCQQWTRGAARTECHVQQQQQRSPTGTDAVPAPAETI